MAPIYRDSNKRKRTRNRTTAARKAARRGSIASTSTASNGSRNRRPSVQVSRMANLTNVGGTRTVKVMKAGKKLAPSKKGPKKVKVTKTFKDKVLKSVQAKQIMGRFGSCQFENVEMGLAANRQAIQLMPNTGLPLAGSLFNATRIFHVASRLWAGQGANVNPSYPISAGPSTNYFNEKNVRIDVKKQFWHFTAKNNTTRTVKVKVYHASPKRSFSNTAFGAGGDPLQMWDAGLQQLYNSGELIGRYVNPIGGLLLDYPYKELLGASPRMSKLLTQDYSLSYTEYLVQPGQDFDWVINGPAGITDFAKFQENDDMMPFQKDDIWQFIVAEYDIAASKFEGITSYHIPAESTPIDVAHRLIVKCNYHCSLAMPEQTGFTEPAVTPVPGNNLYLDKRKHVVCYDDFTPSPTITGLVDRIDDTLSSVPVI